MSPRKYEGVCECPQCGMGSKDLVPDALPYIIAELGTTVKLRCQICGKEWLQRVSQ